MFRISQFFRLFHFIIFDLVLLLHFSEFSFLTFQPLDLHTGSSLALVFYDTTTLQSSHDLPVFISFYPLGFYKDR